MERTFTQKLRDFLDDPCDLTFDALNIDDYILDDPVLDRELTAALLDYTDGDTLKIAYELAIARRNDVEEPSSQEYTKIDNLGAIIFERIEDLDPRGVQIPLNLGNRFYPT